MYTIRKKFRFESAHILSDSYSKDCRNFHGHSYIMEVFISSKTLNEDAMVIDFGKLKEIVKPLIDRWDHSLMLQESIREKVFYKNFHLKLEVVDFNPTAENMAKYAYSWIETELPRHLKLKVRIHETETGYAEYSE